MSSFCVTQFRTWATQVLREYSIKGFAITVGSIGVG